MEKLMKIFNSEVPIVLCDNKDIEDSLRLAGIEAFDVHQASIEETLRNCNSVVMVISDPNLDRKLLKEKISKLNVLMLPCYAFSSTTAETIYTPESVG